MPPLAPSGGALQNIFLRAMVLMVHPMRHTLLWIAGVVATLVTGYAYADDVLVVSPDVMKEFDAYKAQFRPLFFAVSADGLYSGYLYCLDAVCDTSPQTRRQAVKLCESSGGVDCRIFAAGTDIQVAYRVGDPAKMVPAKHPPCVIDAIAAGSPAAALVAPLLPSECSDLRRYGYLEDFKAFAATNGTPRKNTWGWAYSRKSPADALKGALDECDKGRKEYSVTAPCQVIAIGSIVVIGLNDAQQHGAADLYKSKHDATNADLPAGN
jgi:hypothetical protein